MYIPLSTILCPFHMEKTQSSSCHLVSGWSLQKTISYQDFNADIYCCQALSSSVIQVSRAKRKFMQLSLYVASSLPLCSWVQWAITWAAGKKGWLTPREHVTLFAWLFWAFSAVNTLCVAFTGNTNIFTVLAHSERFIHILLSQSTLLPIECCSF